MPILRDFIGHGQSVWYDYLRRSFITSGDLQALIDQGLRGVTSNPAIFEAAIVGSVDYEMSRVRGVRLGGRVHETGRTHMGAGLPN